MGTRTSASNGVMTPYRVLIFGIIALFMAMIPACTVMFGVPAGVAVALLPAAAIVILGVLRNPFNGLVLLFVFNYFITYVIALTRVDGLSAVFDMLIMFIFLSVLMNAAAQSGNYNPLHWNGLLVAALIWAAYCSLEVLNPTALTSAWVRARGLSFYMLVISVMTMLVVRGFRDIKTILYVLSILTLVGVGQGIVQQLFGFNALEMRMLRDEMARTHLLATGTRYFSIFASAGIFGAVMGHAAIVFLITGIYTKGWERAWFLLVAALAMYGLIISGTRGAISIPVGGLILFTLLSRKWKLIVPTLSVLVIGYVFLAMTTIGQGNQYIRRMRTVLDPNEPSLVVRRNNQKLFAEYLKDRPFGEGLALSGVDAQHISQRFTTSIPTDSWFVKIWVETGIVGLCLHLAVLLFVVVYGCYILMFRVKNESLRGILSALHCGVFGVLIASYGNQVLGQYPVVLIVYSSMALVFIGPAIDRKLDRQPAETTAKEEGKMISSIGRT